MKNRKVFNCDCGWVFHSLHLDIDEGFLVVSVVNAPRDYSFRERLKMAWGVLRGRYDALDWNAR